MLVRANNGKACEAYRFEGGVSAWRIDKSVGQGGFNVRKDVLTIQRLLNLIAAKDGGPLPPLDEDGYIGPLTIGAIKNFQLFHKTGSDARVDPNGPTLKKMNAVPKQALAERNKARLALAAQSMPDLTAMANKAQRMAQSARDFVMLDSGAQTASSRAYELANLYFALDKLTREIKLNKLGFIGKTFGRVRTVLMRRPSPLTGGDPFGVSIFTIDPVGRDWYAYSPMQLADYNREHPDIHSGHVYLCKLLDSALPDHRTHILFHELIHFVDDESKERQIVDAKNGYRDGAMKLNHEQRMHNSDNYALFASHVHFGRERLLASQPKLQPYIPSHL